MIPPMHVLAVANHKGGVGKTVTAVNLAAGLAAAGQRTLLIDADAQAHATLWFLDDPTAIAHDLQDVLARGLPLAEAVQPTTVPGLDLLPSTLALARLELDLVALPRREERLRRALAAPLPYAYVVVDLAPSLSLVSLNALAAATGLIAPVTPTHLAVAALGSFLGWIEEFRQEEVVRAPLLGVLLTMAEPRRRVTAEVQQALAAHRLPLFQTVIPRRAAVEEHVAQRRHLAEGMPGLAPRPEAGAMPSGEDPVLAAYRAFTAEVLAATRR
jgi:chromosome partitioning protein